MIVFGSARCQDVDTCRKRGLELDELNEQQLEFWRGFHLEREEALRMLRHGSTRLIDSFIDRCEELGLSEMAKKYAGIFGKKS